MSMAVTAQVESATAMAAATDNRNREKILFVDDEESILEIVCEYFQRKEYEVITASNGHDALDILSREPIDCCFTDINMPEMDGLELAERIHNSDNTIPVVMMTGYPSLDNTIRTLKNGVVDFLIKPVDLHQIELCLHRVMRERRLFVENIILKKEMESKARLQKLNQELLYKVDELGILNKILKGFSAADSSPGLFKRVVEMTRDITHAQAARFYVINEAAGQPVQVAAAVGPASGSPGHANRCFSEPANTTPDHEEHRAPDQLLMDTVADQIPLLLSQNDGNRGLPPEIRSFLAVPLKIREKVFGVLTAASLEARQPLNEKDLYYLSFMTQNAAHSIENLALYENIYENLFATLYAFVTALEARDRYTQQHSNRVTDIALVMGRALNCDSEELDILNVAGRLHDIGKIGIRDDILLKPGRLNEDEFEKIKTHPVIGAGIVEKLGLWNREKWIIRHHHERYDGGGYPDGLTRDEIPFLSRILSVADAYDAMASDRAYRRKMRSERVLEIIREGSGSQWDPGVVGVFLELYADEKIPDHTLPSEIGPGE